MAQKNIVPVFQCFTNATMGVGTIISPVTSINYTDNAAVQFNFTGTPVGTFQVQVSLDFNPQFSNPGNWVPLNLSPTPVASGSAGSIIIDCNQLGAPWLRVVYIGTSGSGVLNSFVTAKGV